MTDGERLNIQGIVPVLVAPFTVEEELDLESLRRLVEFSVAKQLSAVCLPAYGSEFYKLSMDERYALVETAVETSDGRLCVVAQSNHFSAKLAAEIAKRNEESGAGAISVAVPRLFALPEEDIFRFLATVLEATSLPVLIQDFNPAGATVSPSFVGRLNREYPQFRYLKLEEPLMAPKLRQIQEETEGGVEVLEGWGGLYLVEGILSGACGSMPGLGMAELLQEVFSLAKVGDFKTALDIFSEVLPHIVFSLQNLELYLYMEKQLLLERGLITKSVVRSATFTPDQDTVRYVQVLTDRVLEALQRHDERQAIVNPTEPRTA